MQVSVVIPVYNAAGFIRAAVESALVQPEVQEIVLVEDGSRDDTYRICHELTQNQRVRLLRHPDNANHGAAASRNLGIRNATMPFIAFLDADDTYEYSRFEVAKRIFAEHADADGVHEMIGVHFHDSDGQGKVIHPSQSRTGITIPVIPEQLFRVLATGKHGHISLDGLVIRQSAIDPDNLLDPTLKLSEDSDFILRLAASRRIYGGDLSRLVAKRGVHGQNSFLTNPYIMFFRRKYLQKCIDHDFYGSKDLIAQLYILTRRIGAAKFYTPFRKLGKFGLPVKVIGIVAYLFMRPKLLLNLIKLAISRT